MSGGRQSYLRQHRAHDAEALLACWENVVPHDGWQMGVLGHAGDFPLFVIESEVFDRPRFYVSTGVHGDEAAPPWALLEWFVENMAELFAHAVTLLPCLNPLGLIANTRTDERGEDLNRLFHEKKHPVAGPWNEVMSERPLGMTIMLHEDFDGQGTYGYEICHPGQKPVMDKLMKSADAIIPRDPRPEIDGRDFKKGVLTRTDLPTDLPGEPEAFLLHRYGASYNLTFETPSEYSLFERVCAHKAFLSASWNFWKKQLKA